jgi:elongator complex protein 1
MIEAASTHVEDMDELEEQVNKQVKRLGELKVRREQNPGECLVLPLFGLTMCRRADQSSWEDDFMGRFDPEAGVAENVDVDNASTVAGTEFTRYTVAPTTAGISHGSSKRSGCDIIFRALTIRLTRLTPRSERNRRTNSSARKAERNRLTGKKGSIYEENYLLGSLTRTIEGRLATVQSEFSGCALFTSMKPLAEHGFTLDEAGSLARFMLSLSASTSPHAAELRQESMELVRRLERLHSRLGEAVEEVWGSDVDQPKPAPVDPSDEKIAKPKVPRLSQSWRTGLLEVLE